jgi:hypothetical protein
MFDPSRPKRHVAVACALSSCLLLLSLSTAGAADSTPSADLALSRLANEAIFAFGGVGFAGRTSSGEKDYRLILSRPSAEQAFEKLFSMGTPAAQCYALVALRKLDPAKFEELSLSLRSSTLSVLIMHGCLVGHQSLAALVKGIQAGSYPY